MKIEEQVLSVEQAKYLQKLGLDMSDAAFVYVQVYSVDERWEVFPKWMLNEDNYDQDRIYTYTLQEVLHKLPKAIKVMGRTKPRFIDDVDCRVWYGDYLSNTTRYAEFSEDTFFDAAYKMLCWVIENGYLKEGKNDKE